MILAIDQDGPIAVAAPPGPLVHADDVQGGDVGCRSRPHQSHQGVGAASPSQPGHEPRTGCPAEGDAISEEELGEAQRPSRPRSGHGGQTFREYLTGARGMVRRSSADWLSALAIAALFALATWRYTSSRCTVTERGASIPRRIWSPRTSRTVTRMSLPMTTDSPCFRLRTSTSGHRQDTQGDVGH